MDITSDKYIAYIWISAGLVGVALDAVFAVSHFVFGAPFFSRDTRTLAASWQMAGVYAALAAAFGALAVRGVFRLRRRSPPRQMNQASSPLIDGVLAKLYWPALSLAWFDAGLVPASLAGIPRITLQVVLWTTAALAAVHFLLMLLDGATRSAVNTYNARLSVLKGAARRKFAADIPRSIKHGLLLMRTAMILGVEAMLAAFVSGCVDPALFGGVG